MTNTAQKPKAVAPELAPSASSFLGRDEEIAEILELLDEVRLVTLTGPPGIGKSRLAIEVAARRSESQSVEIGLVELAAVGDPDHVPAALAASLSIQEVPGESIGGTIVSRLHERRLLLVLDNCEHLLEACAELVDTLLEGCPDITILATSREPLGSSGELLWHVPPLSLPDQLDPLDAEQLMTYEAVHLFVERARAVEPGFALNHYIAPAVVEICQGLDGIPLAIELAAARVESLTPAEIAQRLDDRFDLLANSGRADPARHRTLEAAIDWSYELLSDSERGLLRRLSVFVGGFDLEAATSICPGDEVAPHAVPELLERLISKSLVASDPEHGRLRLLETIRAYAGDRLEEAGEARPRREAHASFYMALAEKAEPELIGPDQQRWFECLEPERPNLRSALEWSVGHGRAELALRLSGALVLFWLVRCHFSEGRSLLSAARAASEDRVEYLWAKAQWGEAFLMGMAGDIQGAIPLLQESLERFRELGERQGSARALLILGNFTGASDGPTGLSLVEESASLAREVSDTWCLINALGVAGFDYCSRHELAAARPLFEECLTVARTAQDKHGLRQGLLGLGVVAVRTGDNRSAEALLEQCVIVTDELGELYTKGTALRYLGHTAFARGDYGRAGDLLDQSISLHRSSSPAGLAQALVMRARVAEGEGRRDEAIAFAEEALALARTGAPGLVTALLGMGDLVLAKGDRPAARLLFEEALALARRAHDGLIEGQALRGLGQIARAEGVLDRAMTLFLEALQLQLEAGNPREIATSLEAVAGVAAEAGRHEHAVRLFAAANRARDEIDDVRPPSGIRYRQDFARARDGLSDEDFRRASSQGSALSLQEAVAEASANGGASSYDSSGWSRLTERERGAAALVAQGLTNPEIAERLHLSAATIKVRLSTIFRKLGMTRRSELAREFARREQLPQADLDRQTAEDPKK